MLRAVRSAGETTRDAAADPEQGLARRIILLSLAAFASASSARVSDSLLPQLADTFAITTGRAAQAVSAFALAYGVLQLAFGPLGDRYGKFRVITFATLASIVAAAGSALARGFEALVIFRAMNGATAAALIPLAMAWIADNVPYANRQHVLAYFLTGQILGVIGGQFLGGVFADLTGWRGAFGCIAVIYLVIGGLLVAEIRRSSGIDQVVASGAGAAEFGARVIAILRAPWPCIILSCVFVEGALLFGALTFIPTYLHQRFGISLSLAGAAIGVFGIGGLTYTSFSRYFVRRLGERWMAAIGGAVAGAAYLLLLAGAHWLWVLPSAWGVGFGFYMLHNTLQTNATQMAPAARGSAVALFASSLFLGQSIGVALGSVLIDRWGIGAVFGISGLLLPAVGAFLSVKLATRPS